MMRQYQIAGLMMATANAPSGNTARSMAAAPLPGAAVADAISGDKPVEVVKRSTADLLPFVLAGFSINIGAKGYVQTEKRGDVAVPVSMSRRLATMIVKLKGSDVPFYFEGTVSRVVPTDDKGNPTAGGKGSFRFALPASQKAGGAFAAAVIKTDDQRGKDALEAWKREIVAPAFKDWARGQEQIKAATAEGASSTVGNGLIEMDLD